MGGGYQTQNGMGWRENERILERENVTAMGRKDMHNGYNTHMPMIGHHCLFKSLTNQVCLERNAQTEVLEHKLKTFVV